MNATTVREDAADRGECKRCGAAPGEVCRTPSGRVAEMVHAGRPVKPRDDAHAREAQQFRESQGLRAVPMRSIVKRDIKGAAVSPKRATRRERKRALQRKRGFNV